MVTNILVGVILAGLGYLIYEIKTQRAEASSGRAKFYKQLADHSERLTKLEAQHKINHPGQ